MKYIFCVLASSLAASAAEMAPEAKVQNNTFNATHGPFNPSTAAQRIAQADLSPELSDAVLTALNFERSNWAGTSVRLDPFYADLPSNWSDAAPGSVIKVEQYTNTSLYTIAPTLAISRILFTSKNVNGSVVPASAYVLWPYSPRRFDSNDGWPVIGWGHGTSGWSGECAPSHIRTLWYQFMIFTAATQGYVVVAPDYAGLGVDHDGTNFVPHQYLANEAAGSDIIYAVKASQKAWDELGSNYVVMGHSQGGGAAWGAAQVLGGEGEDARELRKGYLGSIPGSPWTDFLNAVRFEPTATAENSIVSRVAIGVKSVFPTFDYSDWLTEKGVRLVQLLQDLQGCQSVATELFTDSDILKPRWNESWYASAWTNLTTSVAKPIAGPLLVLHGTGDSVLNATGTQIAVNETCESVPDAQIEYAEFEGVSHTAVMFSGQQVWLDWIRDRFAGVEAKKGCHKVKYEPSLEISRFQKDRNWFLEWSQYAYGTA